MHENMDHSKTQWNKVSVARGQSTAAAETEERWRFIISLLLRGDVAYTPDYTPYTPDLLTRPGLLTEKSGNIPQL